MTKATLARRLASLERRQRTDDVAMTIAVLIVNSDGKTHQIVPAQPIAGFNDPNRRVDYRAAIAYHDD